MVLGEFQICVQILGRGGGGGWRVVTVMGTTIFHRGDGKGHAVGLHGPRNGKQTILAGRHEFQRTRWDGEIRDDQTTDMIGMVLFQDGQKEIGRAHV